MLSCGLSQAQLCYKYRLQVVKQQALTDEFQRVINYKRNTFTSNNKEKRTEEIQM